MLKNKIYKQINKKDKTEEKKQTGIFAFKNNPFRGKPERFACRLIVCRFN